jgi:hypothetical protein
MKYYALILVAAWGWVACSTPGGEATTPEAEPVWTAYGEPFETREVIPFSDVKKVWGAQDSIATGVFEAEIIETCTKMGCWLSVKGPDDDTVMVFMRDHAFFVPKEGMQGKRVMMSGYAYYDTTSVADLQHLAEDAGRTPEEIAAITEPKFTLNFDAAGVQILGVPAAYLEEEAEDEAQGASEAHEGH